MASSYLRLLFVVVLAILGSPAAESQVDGAIVEILTQNDEVVRFELHSAAY